MTTATQTRTAARAVVFLADGRMVAHMADPTAERVLDTIKRLGS